MPLHEALKRHARVAPANAAVIVGDRRVTYGDLAYRSERLNALVVNLPRVGRSQGALAGRPVFALLMGNHPHVAEFLVAALAGPSCVVLLDPLLPEDRLLEILERLPPDILFTAGQTTDRFQDRGFPVVKVETEDDLKGLLQDAPDVELPASLDDDPFLVAFTSGTTSRPKAFVRFRRSWRASLSAGREHFELGPGSNTFSPGPLAHGLALYAFAETLEVGATYYALEKFTPATGWAVLKDHEHARLVCVPSVLEALCRYRTAVGGTLDALSQVTTSGAKLPDSLLERIREIAPNAKVTEYYGASELGFVASLTMTPTASGYAGNGTGVGGPFPGITIEIRDTDGIRSEDGVGTVWVNSYLMIEEYLWHDDNIAFRREGSWGTVGDMGRLTVAGDLELLGRAGGMINSGGNNIYPAEVIACLSRHPAVKDASVLGRPDTYLGQKLVAVIGLRDNDAVPTLDELLAFCAENLQKYKVPRQIYVASEWPMTSSGKISTGRLEEWITENDDRLVLL